MSSSSIMTVSESTSSSRPRVGGASVRKAKLQDAVNIFELVNSLSGDGTLLRRSYSEICENVRDFVVAESESGIFLGCGALHHEAHKRVAIHVIDATIDIDFLNVLIVGLLNIVDDELGLHCHLACE